MIVFGIAKIKSIKLTAMLSGLKLEGEIRELQSSLQYKEKIRAPQRGMVEASVVGNMQETNIALLEGLPGKLQTIVKVIFGRSQLLYSSQMWKTKDKNSGTLNVDLIQVCVWNTDATADATADAAADATADNDKTEMLVQQLMQWLTQQLFQSEFTRAKTMQERLYGLKKILCFEFAACFLSPSKRVKKRGKFKTKNFFQSVL